MIFVKLNIWEVGHFYTGCLFDSLQFGSGIAVW